MSARGNISRVRDTQHSKETLTLLSVCQTVIEAYHSGRLAWGKPYTLECESKPMKPRRRMPALKEWAWRDSRPKAKKQIGVGGD